MTKRSIIWLGFMLFLIGVFVGQHDPELHKREYFERPIHVTMPFSNGQYFEFTLTAHCDTLQLSREERLILINKSALQPHVCNKPEGCDADELTMSGGKQGAPK